MAVKQGLTKRRRGKGRPLKEESNAMQLEKNILDLKMKMIAMIPDAQKVLSDLMMNPSTKDNIRENIAKFVIEEGKQMLSDYFDEENENEEETSNVDDGRKNGEEVLTKPFSTDIIPMKQSNQ